MPLVVDEDLWRTDALEKASVFPLKLRAAFMLKSLKVSPLRYLGVSDPRDSDRLRNSKNCRSVLQWSPLSHSQSCPRWSSKSSQSTVVLWEPWTLAARLFYKKSRSPAPPLKNLIPLILAPGAPASPEPTTR